MITTESELDLVREQLHRAESALQATRRKFADNPIQYRLFSETTIDLIRSLRADIDAYLGVAPTRENAAVTISLEGREVSLGITSAGLVTRFVDSFRRGLQSVYEVLESGTAGRRPPAWAARACDLPLLGVAPGSVQVLLGQPETSHLFAEDDSRRLNEAIDVLFAGLEWSSDETPPESFERLSPTVRQAVLKIVTRLLPPHSGPVEQVAFERAVPGKPRQMRRATLDRNTRDRVRAELARLAADRKYTDVEGVIRSVDLDAQKFTLRDRSNNSPDLPCVFGPQTEAAVKEFLDCRVVVSGTVETNRVNQQQRMEVEAIELIADDEQEELPPVKESTSTG